MTEAELNSLLATAFPDAAREAIVSDVGALLGSLAEKRLLLAGPGSETP